MDNAENFLSVASQAKDIAAFFAPALITIAIMLYVTARAGSAGFIHSRLWRLLGGKKDYEDPVLKREQSQLSDFEKFRYDTGIRFQSRKNISETIKWLHSNKIGIEELTRVNTHFDHINICIKRPRINCYKVAFASMFSFFIASTLIFMLSALPAALLTIKETKTTIWASESAAWAWNGYNWKITETECNSGALEKLDLALHDKKVICEILTNKSNVTHIKSIIKSQKIIGALFWLVGLFLAFSTGRSLATANLAHSLWQRETSGNASL